MIIRTLAIAAVATALAGAPAFAQSPDGRVTVRYADLDLTTAAGVQKLHRRVAAALETACGSYAGTDSSAGMPEADAITACRAANRATIDQRVAMIVGKAQFAAR